MAENELIWVRVNVRVRVRVGIRVRVRVSVSVRVRCMQALCCHVIMLPWICHYAAMAMSLCCHGHVIARRISASPQL